MEDTEKLLDLGDEKAATAFRKSAIAKIGAWSVDHPNEKPDYRAIFSTAISKLETAYFAERRRQIKRACEDLATFLTEGPAGLSEKARSQSAAALTALSATEGYCADCVRVTVLALLKERLADS